MTTTHSGGRPAFEQLLATAWPPAQWCDVTVVAAVSGGPDSVALLRGLAAIQSAGVGAVRAAHFNHRLRGADSDADEAFVRELCADLQVECDVGRAETAIQACGDGVEAAARNQRYSFLQSAAERCGARFVVTAHTADDQAETILHRILRGTSITGLAGMRRARPLGVLTLLRPLLGISRVQIEAYLSELGQPARLDRSNADLTLTRNRIRRELLPLLAEQYNPAIGDALRRLGQVAAEAQEALRPQVETLQATCVVFRDGASVRIDCQQLAAAPVHLVRELLVAVWQHQQWPLQAMGFDVWQALAELAQASALTSSRRVFPGSIAAQKKGGELLLARL